MGEKVTQEELEIVRRWSMGNPRVLRAWVFGSRWKGTARLDSDIDITAEIEYERAPEENEFTSFLCSDFNEFQVIAAEELSALLPYQVDFKVYAGPTCTDQLHEAINEASGLVFASERPEGRVPSATLLGATADDLPCWASARGVARSGRAARSAAL